MTFEFSVLVVANRTAASDELLDALCARAARGPARFTLLVPASPQADGGRAAARARLEDAVDQLRAAGLQVHGELGCRDPATAVGEIWSPGRFDEVIVSTLPSHASRWLLADLPHRIERMTGAPVTHVVSREARRALHAVRLPERTRPGVLAPLQVLGWGGRHEPAHAVREPARTP